jgi:hypothetical protein
MRCPDKLTHYSTSPVVNLYSKNQRNSTVKPEGLWYEVNGDWVRWCEAEELGWTTEKMLYSVDLGESNVLKISSVEELDDFTEKFVRLLQPEVLWEYPQWAEVAKLWDGLQISPYLWERRLTSMWYYGWDCASGVLWRPRKASVMLMGETGSLKKEANAIIRANRVIVRRV